MHAAQLIPTADDCALDYRLLPARFCTVLGAMEPNFELAASHTCASLSLYTLSALYATLITRRHSGDLSDGSGSQSCFLSSETAHIHIPYPHCIACSFDSKLSDVYSSSFGGDSSLGFNLGIVP